MINRAAGRKKFVALAIALILFIAVTSALSSYLQLNLGLNVNAVVSQNPKQTPNPQSTSGNNGTGRLNPADFYNNSSAPNSTVPISKDNVKLESYAYCRYSVYPPDISPIYSVSENTDQGQTPESNSTLPTNSTGSTDTNRSNTTDSSNRNSSTLSTPEPVFLQNSNFTTYTYGGYPVEQADGTQFYFSFPDTTTFGELEGSDAISLDCYSIQKIDFDATFIAPKTDASGFDEMAIFAASNTVTYKGTEFGIRMDLKTGSIYGYIQEPNDVDGDVDFQMIELMRNDGVNHHYSLVASGSEVTFFIDGGDFGHLNFSSGIDCSNFTFSICAVVHRFTDVWDSGGDNMTVGNFSIS